MNLSLVIGLILLTRTTGLAQSLPSDTTKRCEQLVVLQADAARNPSREFSLDLRGADGARFVYLGVRHTFDPADPQFANMQAAWERLQLLAQAWKPGARIFVAVGRDHIPAQAAALRCALQ